MATRAPRIVVFSSLFPSDEQPVAGLFIRERMFRLGKRLPIVVVSPQPWFPLQGLIRLLKPGYRRIGARLEARDGIVIHRPRFLSLPGIGRRFDGLSMAVCSLGLMRRLRRTFGYTVIDAHFAYPDGYAATRLGKWLKLPVTITLRGTEIPLARIPARSQRMTRALLDATRIFSVSRSLKDHAVSLGVVADKIEVIANGVDIQRFQPMDKATARRALGITAEAKVLISVGALVERKGFHRIIALLPALRAEFADLRYLVVGGPSPEGDWTTRLREQVNRLGLKQVVTFTGPIAPDALRRPLSAADVFVLSTGNEGWANVFLEAMACGLPVVATDVGGNAEVVGHDWLGTIVPFADQHAMRSALGSALRQDWDRARIVAYARQNAWERRIEQLESAFKQVVFTSAPEGTETHAGLLR